MLAVQQTQFCCVYAEMTPRSELIIIQNPPFFPINVHTVGCSNHTTGVSVRPGFPLLIYVNSYKTCFGFLTQPTEISVCDVALRTSHHVSSVNF